MVANRVWSDPLGAIVQTPRRRAAAAAVLAGIVLIGSGLLLMGPTADGPQVLGTLEERTTTTVTTTTTISDDTTTTTAASPDTPDPAVPPPGTDPAPAPQPPPAEPAPVEPVPAPPPDDGAGTGEGEATDPRPCGEGHPVDESEEPQPGCYWKASDNALVVEIAQGEFADWTSSSTVGPRWLTFELGIQGEPAAHEDGHEVTVTVALTNVLDRPVLFDGPVAVQLVVQHQGAVTHLLDVVLSDVDRLGPGETRQGTATFVVSGEGRHDIHGETVFALD